ncbi:short chain dehydrogenase [Plenodomus tracheiphilus IPT5]|uniref:Short chain dehydrogenase n=1 Tax=Plenodomus tracheiphilus IPT5 TaxID=1408161 RepID=A0A6A7BD88_9PLEO|nr:short chain dehydrogenase [Plenodomus tracheiphilus IPT5]
MPSYFVTGAARGIGFAFLDKLSSDPANTVVGLVRNKADTEAKISKAGWNRPNVHIVQGDLNEHKTLKLAAETTSQITGGSLDCLIANAAYLPSEYMVDPLSVLGADPAKLETEMHKFFQTNCIGNIHLFNFFIPLILKGNLKKVISITSGMADVELVRSYDIFEGGPYAISKAAMNVATAKFAAEYAKDGVLFLSVCPGFVDTGYEDSGKLCCAVLLAQDFSTDVTIASERVQQQLTAMLGKFQRYAPHFAGLAAPEDAVKDVLSVVEKASIANGDSGAYLSHSGTKQWV